MTSANSMSVVGRFQFLLDCQDKPIPGLDIIDLLKFLDSPINHFMLRDMVVGQHPELVESAIWYSLKRHKNFWIDGTFLEMARPHISRKLTRAIMKHGKLLKPDAELTCRECLLGINDNIFVGVHDEDQLATIQANYLTPVEVHKEYVRLPDIPMILFEWYQKYKVDEDAGLEEHLLTVKIPAWFVALIRMMDMVANDEGGDLLREVNHQVLQMMKEPGCKTLLEYFIRKRVLGRPNWSLFNVFRAESLLTVDASFVLLVASGQIDEGILEDLMQKYRHLLSEKAIGNLRFVNTM